jgi:hypothetical protein
VQSCGVIAKDRNGFAAAPSTMVAQRLLLGSAHVFSLFKS